MLRSGQIIALCALSLLCVGVVMVHSAGVRVGDGASETFTSIIVSRSTVYAALAMGALFLTSRLPLRRWFLGRSPRSLSALALSWAPAILMALCLLVYLPGVGREVNGAARWLGVRLPGVGMLSFQPSELAKWGLVLAMAWRAARLGPRLERFWIGLAPELALTGLVAGVIAVEDLGTAILTCAAVGVTLVAGGARVRHFAAMAPIGLALVGVAVAVQPYRVRRLTSFLDPFADPEGAGYHMIQSMSAVANGEGFGRGLGFGLQKFGYLPEDQTDFLFAVIAEELGVAGAALVASLYLVIVWTGLSVIRREASVALKLAGIGLVTVLGAQAVINLFAVTGLGPTKGIALPLLSAGGSGWILTAASLGVLVGMDRDHARSAHRAEPDLRGRRRAAPTPRIVTRRLAPVAARAPERLAR